MLTKILIWEICNFHHSFIDKKAICKISHLLSTRAWTQVNIFKLLVQDSYKTQTASFSQDWTAGFGLQVQYLIATEEHRARCHTVSVSKQTQRMDSTHMAMSYLTFMLNSSCWFSSSGLKVSQHPNERKYIVMVRISFSLLIFQMGRIITVMIKWDDLCKMTDTK